MSNNFKYTFKPLTTATVPKSNTVLPPETAHALFTKAFHLHQSGQLEQAKPLYELVYQNYPNHFDALHLRGVIALQQKNFDIAIDLISKAIQINSKSADAHVNRGVAFKHKKLLEEAISDYDTALKINAEHVDAYTNRGIALREIKRPDAAVLSYNKALAFSPENAEAYSNRGNALRDLELYEQAEADYERAIELKPNYADAHWNLGICSLQLGNFERGWAESEWRWRIETQGTRQTIEDVHRPLWLGNSPLTGKTILLHSEQGFGDTLQFCRYAELVANLGATVVLEARQPLLGVLSTLKGVHHLLAAGHARPAFDVHCPLMSLPLAFKTTINTIPGNTPYLRTEAAKRAQWSHRLGAKTKPRLGIAWSGNPAHTNDSNRSIALRDFLTALPDTYECVSLQKELRPFDQEALAKHPQLLRFENDINDFADTAALCDLMDVVLSVDTSVAHLAGALGKPVWVLLPTNPDWRWMLKRTDSPWYPTARLYRQHQTGDWTPVLERVKADLQQAAAHTL